MIQVLLGLCPIDNHDSCSRVTRNLFHRIQAVFPELSRTDVYKHHNQIEWSRATKIRRATRIIEDRRRSLLRMRPKNDTCVITQKALSDIDVVFRYIQNNGYVRGYCATSLGYYFASNTEATDPVTRTEYTSVELRRLCRLVPRLRKPILTDRMQFWRTVFTSATMNILHSLLPLVVHLQDGLNESVFNLVSGGDGALSSFFAQATYLYACSKPKYRTLKNEFLARAGNNKFAKQTVDFLDGVCFNLFRFHEIVFAFQGDRAIPILTDIGTLPILI